MDSLIQVIQKLQSSELSGTITKRIQSFRGVGKSGSKNVFSELCFCILTANFNAERAIVIQESVGEGFLSFSGRKLAARLKKLGYRYPNARANYIVEARVHLDSLESILATLNGNELRDWFVENVKGLGFKESSHFLRNIGFPDYAILDFHIINILVEYGVIEKPRNLNKKFYLEIEKELRKLGTKLDLTLAELDFYLWYLETSKILK
ncbi:MAG: N-glycosylase/DNA lyase [Methanobacteriota archaeon]